MAKCAGCLKEMPEFGRFRTFFNTGNAPSDKVHDDDRCVDLRNARRALADYKKTGGVSIDDLKRELGSQ